MDFHVLFFPEHRDAFIAARLESVRRYHRGTGSPVVAMIGALAAAMRRGAAAIETWSRGTSDGVIQRHVSVR